MSNTSHARSADSSFHQHGFTLVEVMVAMVIALFLLGGLLTLVSGTRQINSNQTALTQLQDEQRLAMSLLNDVIQHAGYFPDPTSQNPAVVMPVAGDYATAGQAIYGTHAAAGDTIEVQFMTSGADNLINCQGGSNPGAATIYSNIFSIDGNNNLVCTVNGGAAVALVGGVTNLQVLYGINTLGNLATGYPGSDVDTYMTATQVNTAGDWLRVTTVRVTVTFSNPICTQTPGAACPGQAATISFTRTINLMGRSGVVT